MKVAGEHPGAGNFGLRALFKAMYGEVAFEEFQFIWSVLTDQYHRFIYPSSFLWVSMRFILLGKRSSLLYNKLLLTIKQNKMANPTELKVKGNWNEQKGKLKKKFATLTDNDLMFEEGKKDEMLGKLQIKLGKSKEELKKIMDTL
jgi:uncharacterized protein YjbJ (UPF0337 family)